MKRSLQKAMGVAMSLLLCLPMALNLSATSTPGKAGGVTVETGKGETESTSTKKSPTAFPYANRIKAKDIAGYKASDFIDKNAEPVGKLDPRSGRKLTQLNGSNWYLADNITELLSVTTNTNVGMLYGEAGEEPTAEADVAIGDVIDEESVEETIDEAPATSSASGAGDRHSTTTAQVEGVDEADIIKTDGQYIYYMSRGNGVAIVKAGKTPQQIATLQPGGRVGVDLPAYQDMYISGKKLIITATAYNSSLGQEFVDAVPSMRYSPSTSFFIYDMSNPAEPVLDRTVEVAGHLNTSRMYNNSIYFVTNAGSYGSLNESILSTLPLYKDSALGEDVYVFTPSDIYLSVDQSSYGASFTILSAFSLNDDTPISPKAYQGYTDSFYMNKNAFYMTSSYYYWGGKEPRPLRDGMSFIEPAVGSGTNAMTINRFTLSKNGMQFQSMGSVPGYVINQYSMDEYNGTFRIATTSNDKKTYRPENNVYVLDAQTMKELGSVTGLAKNETIQSVRFRGNTGYVVTFENTDPLFVIDLKDSQNPNVVGELKIPGFSTYLHPFTDKYVIGLGRETAETYMRNPDGTEVVVGNVQSGVKLSMFDVSNPQKPREVHKMVIGGQGSYTEAMNDPKAIMFDMEKGIMAFPMDFHNVTTDRAGKETKEDWRGGFVAEFSAKGFALGAKIKMDDYYSAYSSRFVYINDVLYYVANQQLVAMEYSNYKIIDHIELSFNK